jgi:hypothetical protein
MTAMLSLDLCAPPYCWMTNVGPPHANSANTVPIDAHATAAQTNSVFVRFMAGDYRPARLASWVKDERGHACRSAGSRIRLTTVAISRYCRVVGRLRRWTRLGYYLALGTASALLAACKGENAAKPPTTADARLAEPTIDASAATLPGVSARGASSELPPTDAAPDAQPASRTSRPAHAPAKRGSKGRLWDITLE